MARLDRSFVPQPAQRLIRVFREDSDNTIWLCLGPSADEPPVSIRLEPAQAVGVGSELVELGLLFEAGPSFPSGH